MTRSTSATRAYAGDRSGRSAHLATATFFICTPLVVRSRRAHHAEATLGNSDSRLIRFLTCGYCTVARHTHARTSRLPCSLPAFPPPFHGHGRHDRLASPRLPSAAGAGSGALRTRKVARADGPLRRGPCHMPGSACPCITPIGNGNRPVDSRAAFHRVPVRSSRAGTCPTLDIPKRTTQIIA